MLTLGERATALTLLMKPWVFAISTAVLGEDVPLRLFQKFDHDDRNHVSRVSFLVKQRRFFDIFLDSISTREATLPSQN